jgi:hypothetical protein
MPVRVAASTQVFIYGLSFDYCVRLERENITAGVAAVNRGVLKD